MSSVCVHYGFLFTVYLEQSGCSWNKLFENLLFQDVWMHKILTAMLHHNNNNNYYYFYYYTYQ